MGGGGRLLRMVVWVMHCRIPGGVVYITVHGDVSLEKAPIASRPQVTRGAWFEDKGRERSELAGLREGGAWSSFWVELR